MDTLSYFGLETILNCFKYHRGEFVLSFYCALECHAYRARYCYSKLVRLTVCLSKAGTVSKQMDISSYF